MRKSGKQLESERVALRKESVDRNDAMQVIIVIVHTVALRKESVDRNSFYAKNRHLAKHVALRKESVDRNHTKTGKSQSS